MNHRKNKFYHPKVPKIYYSDKSTDEESYEWFDRNKDLYEFYCQFPFKKWLEIIKEIYDKKDFLDKKMSGPLYQTTVNKVLLNDIFKDKQFIYEKAQKNEEIKLIFEADFIAEIANYQTFYNIINSRKYMFQYENLDRFSQVKNEIHIIGEICNKLSNKNSQQINKYCKAISDNNNNNNKGPIYILMIIFDNNYNDLFSPTKNFRNLNPIRIFKTPVVFGYIPKLYREDCYLFYNKGKKINEEKIEYKKYLKGIFYKANVSEISEEELKKLNEIKQKFDYNLKKKEEEMKKKEEEMKKNLGEKKKEEEN